MDENGGQVAMHFLLLCKWNFFCGFISPKLSSKFKNFHHGKQKHRRSDDQRKLSLSLQMEKETLQKQASDTSNTTHTLQIQGNAT